MNKLLPINVCIAQRWHKLISDQVIYVTCTRGPRETHVRNLNRCRLYCKYLISSPLGITIEVYKDMYLVFIDQFGSHLRWHGRNIYKVLGSWLDALSSFNWIISTPSTIEPSQHFLSSACQKNTEPLRCHPSFLLFDPSLPNLDRLLFLDWIPLPFQKSGASAFSDHLLPLFFFLNTTSFPVHIHIAVFYFTCQNPVFLIFFP